MSIIFAMSVIASAINYVFLVKNLIIPPLKHLVEKALLHFDIDIRGEYYYETSLDEVEYEYAIRRQEEKLLQLHECVPRDSPMH